VNIRAYPQSTFRRDELFTATTGKFPVIPPILSAAALVRLSQGIALWSLVVLISIVWTAISLTRQQGVSPWQWAIWLLSALMLGPLALWIHALAGRQAAGSPLPHWKRAAGAALLSISGYALAWVLAIAMVIGLQREPQPLMILGIFYFTPLLFGLLLVRGPLLLRQGIRRVGKALVQGLLAEILALNLGFAVLFPSSMLIQQHFFSTMPYPNSPYFWGMIWFAAALGLLALFSLYYWMSRRGYRVWYIDPPGGEGIGELAAPTLKNCWGALLTTLGIMVAMIGFTIGRLA
jgi:hypothetical protein